MLDVPDHKEQLKKKVLNSLDESPKDLLIAQYLMAVDLELSKKNTEIDRYDAFFTTLKMFINEA